jgi:hypothetical protein
MTSFVESASFLSFCSELSTRPKAVEGSAAEPDPKMDFGDASGI